MTELIIPKRSVTIGGQTTAAHLPGAPTDYAKQFAENVWRQRMFMFFDPERPKEDADELAKRVGNRPENSLWQCPSCDRKPMTWTLFQAHALPCYIKWRKNVLPLNRRKFAGASVKDAK